MHTRTFEATSNGAVNLDLYGYDSNIEVVADPSCTRGYVEAYTEARSGSSVDAIEALPDVRGNNLRVHLPKGVGGGGSVIVSGSSVVIGGGFTSMMSGVSGDSEMIVNGQRIVTRGGRTWVNGVEITDQGGAGGPAGDPPMPIHFRAVVPYGSSLEAETYNGDVSSQDVPDVRIKTYNGNVRATGLATESRVKTYNGDVVVGAAAGQRPAVNAETYNGDITALDDDIRLRPKTYNGRVRYPN